MKKVGLNILFLIIATTAFCQFSGGGYPVQFWKITNISGEVKLRSLYRQQYNTYGNFSDTRENVYYNGGILLNTKNYIYHPNFLKLDITGEYSPESDVNNYIVTPDRSEIRTLKGFGAQSTLLANSPVTLTGLFDYKENFSNREYLSNLRSKSQRAGASLFWRWKFLPITVSFSDTKYDQKEIETGFSYILNQKFLTAETKKSFGDNDLTEIRFSGNRYERKDFNETKIKNNATNASMSNQIFLNKKQDSFFRSYVFNNHQTGSSYYDLTNVSENLTVKLPFHFISNSNYNYYQLEQSKLSSKLNRSSSNLTHQLFESLRTSLGYTYSQNNQSFSTEKRNTATFDLNYTKRIPTGVINLSYQYMFLQTDMNAEAVLTPVQRDEYTLDDKEIVLISQPFVDKNTVVIKDQTETTIYRPEIDYVLVEQGDFLEIRRIPGGQIPNMATVYIDYMVVQLGAYSYDAISNQIGGSIHLLDGLFKIYTQLSFQDFKNVHYSDQVLLNYYSHYLYGSEIDFKFIRGGIEFDDYISTITPYKMQRYFISVQTDYKDKWIISFIGNIRNYLMLDENLKRNYSDASGNLNYRINKTSGIDVNLAYRKQRGQDINLDLLTGRAEYSIEYRKLLIKAGVEVYKRNYLNDVLNFGGTYVQISRKF